MRSTVKDLLLALLSGAVGENYPKENMIPTPKTDRLLMLEPTFIRHDGNIMLLDLGGKSVDPNESRRDGYNERTLEHAWEDGLIDLVDCEHRPHSHFILTREGYDQAIAIWGKPSATIFIKEGEIPVIGGWEGETTTKLVPITPDGSEFDLSTLPRRLTSDEVEALGYPRPIAEDLHYNVHRENCQDWVEISDPEWMELIRRVDAMTAAA